MTTAPSLPDGVRRLGFADVTCIGEPPVPVRRVARALERAKGDAAKVRLELPGLTDADVEATRQLVARHLADLIEVYPFLVVPAVVLLPMPLLAVPYRREATALWAAITGVLLGLSMAYMAIFMPIHALQRALQ